MADASAALGIIGRTGLGKLRHIDTSYLWLQQESIKKKLRMNKVKGTENPADMNTNGLSGDEITKYIRMLNMGYQEGRANLAPEVQQLMQQTKCKRFNSTTSKVTKRVRISNATPRECSYLDHTSQLHVSESQGNDCTCNCTGCWMYCIHNPRA